MKKPGISLCMIVKNEEHYLKDCLNSVKNLVNEIIIVDTGSTDKTVQIANEFSAKVYHFNWCNDFAKARNESIKHANYQWILYLDADEQIEQKYHNRLKQFVAQKEFAALVFKLKCYTEQNDRTKFYYSYYRRMFKNIEGIKFYGKVHEQITVSLEELDVKSCLSDCEIEHFGYMASKEVMDSKKKRNLDLLLSHLEEDDSDWYSWHQLGTTYASMHEYEKAKAPLKKAINMPDTSQSTMARSYNILSIIASDQKKYLLSQFYARQSLRIASNQNHAYFLKAEACKNEGNNLGAIRELTKALEFKEDQQNRIQQLTSDIVVDNWIIYKEIALNHYHLKQYDEADKFFDLSIQSKEDNFDAIMQKSLLYSELNRFDEADKLIDRLKNQHPQYHLLKANNFKLAKKSDLALTEYQNYLEQTEENEQHLKAIIDITEIHHNNSDEIKRNKEIEFFLEKAKAIFKTHKETDYELLLLKYLKRFNKNNFIFNYLEKFNKTSEQLAFFAQLYIDHNDLKNALNYINKAITIKRNLNYLILRANIHLAMKELTKAEEAYYELSQILPGNTDIQKQYLKIKELKSFH
jgi:glycosyltransferase involved in cell wall biosynthesis